MFPGFQQMPEGQILAFALILLRMTAFAIAMPILSYQTIPIQVKVLFALTLTVLVFPTVSFKNTDLMQMTDQLFMLSFRELVVGLFLGFLLRFFFYAISIAGDLMGMSTGLSSAQIFNPFSGIQSNVFEQFHFALGMLFLLAIDGHHFFIRGIVQSYEIVAIADSGIRYEGMASVAGLVKETFEMGIRMAAPVLVAIFLTNVSMGFLGRAVPQMNILVTSMQVTIIVGLAVFFISLPLYVEEMNQLMTLVAGKFFIAMKGI